MARGRLRRVSGFDRRPPPQPGQQEATIVQIQLSAERRAILLASLAKLFGEEFDDALSSYRAERVLELFLRQLGPPIYNQAIQDARLFMAQKLEDLEGEHFAPEDLNPGGS